MASKKEINNLRGLLIPAGVITGLGVGILTDNVAASMFIGLGAGFAFLALAAIIMSDKNQKSQGQ